MEVNEIPVTHTDDLMLGDMGIKQIYQGDTLLYERQTSYFYLKLITEGED